MVYWRQPQFDVEGTVLGFSYNELRQIVVSGGYPISNYANCKLDFIQLRII